MKTFKKFFTLTLSAFFVFTMLFAFVSCIVVDDGAQAQPLTGTMSVVIDSQEEGQSAKVYTVDLTEYTDKNSVEDVMNDLTKEGLYYEGYKSATGMYYTALGFTTKDEGDGYDITNYILKQDVLAGKYIYVYTSVEKDQDTSNYKTTVTYEGKELVNAGMGASFMHLEAGATVYFTYMVWS